MLNFQVKGSTPNKEINRSNNKAILIFTIVTIVFLPLSFFTSYFGMNVKGISPDIVTQGTFWAVCASITICLVVSVLVWGFKERLHALIWDSRRGSLRKGTAESKTLQGHATGDRRMLRRLTEASPMSV